MPSSSRRRPAHTRRIGLPRVVNALADCRMEFQAVGVDEHDRWWKRTRIDRRETSSPASVPCKKYLPALSPFFGDLEGPIHMAADYPFRPYRVHRLRHVIRVRHLPFRLGSGSPSLSKNEECNQQPRYPTVLYGCQNVSVGRWHSRKTRTHKINGLETSSRAFSARRRRTNSDHTKCADKSFIICKLQPKAVIALIGKSLQVTENMERETGLEPATSSLGSCTSFENKEQMRPWRCILTTANH